jgi:hypothetical protein
MQFTIENIRSSPTTILRRAGYTFQRYTDDKKEMSFVRPLGVNGYPRFHLYVKLDGANLEISFHLDQKKHTYGNSTRHHGEYEKSPILIQEAERLKKFLR